MSLDHGTALSNKFTIDSDTARLVKTYVDMKNAALLELGIIESDYAVNRDMALKQITSANDALMGLIKKAAAELKVPLKDGKWNLDFSTMTFKLEAR